MEEEHNCLVNQGWQACHLLAYSKDTLAGAIPLYLKSNSYGEFVFDWFWAEAYQQAGGEYYPKLVSTIPFSPVCGPRFLISENYPEPKKIKKILLKAVKELTKSKSYSPFHCLFPEQTDKEFFTRYEFLVRKGLQLHWHNQDYANFEEFLNTLTSKKRKQIKRERK